MHVSRTRPEGTAPQATAEGTVRWRWWLPPAVLAAALVLFILLSCSDERARRENFVTAESVLATRLERTITSLDDAIDGLRRIDRIGCDERLGALEHEVLHIQMKNARLSPPSPKLGRIKELLDSSISSALAAAVHARTACGSAMQAGAAAKARTLVRQASRRLAMARAAMENLGIVDLGL